MTRTVFGALGNVTGIGDVVVAVNELGLQLGRQLERIEALLTELVEIGRERP